MPTSWLWKQHNTHHWHPQKGKNEENETEKQTNKELQQAVQQNSTISILNEEEKL